MKLLLTGASGFIGSALLAALRKDYPEQVSDTILLTSKSINGFTCVLHHDYSFETEDFLKHGIDRIDTVLHLGGFIPKSSKEANSVVKSNNNIVTTQRLLENLPSNPSKFLFASTIDVYANDVALPIRETSLTIPGSLYGWSKLYCEKMLQSWGHHNNISMTILRLAHIYGRGEAAYQKLIPTAMRNLIHGVEPCLYTTGTERRAFLHVTDCCHFILQLALSTGNTDSPINIVSENSYSVRDWLTKIIDVTQSDVSIKEARSPSEGRDITFDTTILQKWVGSEKVAIDQGLQDEYKYFLELEMGEKRDK
jgi:UDP-glucose 4-epimerase